MSTKILNGPEAFAAGHGSMRLPVIGGDDSKIDESAAMEMVDYAIRNGINYFDTAWGYHGGNSETVMGKALSRYPREVFIWPANSPVTIFPTWIRWKKFLKSSLKMPGRIF